MDTFLGPFTAIVDDDGAVLASGWTADVDELLPVMHPSLRGTPTPGRELGAVSRAVKAYHDGELTAIDAIPVRQAGTEFLRVGWLRLRDIKPGEPVTYTRLAELVGNPRAVRAAASVCARNAAALFVPCHRVLRLGGAVGGFRWGPAVKASLLAHESIGK